MSTINGVLVTKINPTNLYLEIEDKTRSSHLTNDIRWRSYENVSTPHKSFSKHTKKYRRDIKHERKSSFFL